MTQRVRVDASDALEGALAITIRGSADVAAASALRQLLLDALEPVRDVVVHLG